MCIQSKRMLGFSVVLEKCLQFQDVRLGAEYLAKAACKLLPSDSLTVFLLDPAHADQLLAASYCSTNLVSKRHYVPRGKGIVEHVLKTGKKLMISEGDLFFFFFFFFFFYIFFFS